MRYIAFLEPIPMLRKTIGIPQEAVRPDGSLLDLGTLARFEVSSEDCEHPIDYALIDDDKCWRAGQPGRQIVRLYFDDPPSLSCIRLRFQEKFQTRTQEFLLSWLPAGEANWKEIRRQQFNFNSSASVQIEDITCALAAVQGLELNVIPEIQGGSVASLEFIGVRSG